MSLKHTLILLLGMVLAALLTFQAFQRQLSQSLFAFGTHPEIEEQLERSLADQKELARLDPRGEASYRARLDKIQTVLNRLQVLAYNRQAIRKRYELLLLTVFGSVLLVGCAAYATRQGRQQRRLGRLRHSMSELSAGGEIVVGDHGRDTLGELATMVEETSRTMSRDRRRLAVLENLSAWQETARRLAHEMRTPLTAARLELSRLRALHDRPETAMDGEAQQITRNLLQDLEQLGRFADEFSSFAKLRRPTLVPVDLAALVAEFGETFRTAWPNLTLAGTWAEAAKESMKVAADRDLIRQVLVNLCDNSSLALAEERGEVRFSIQAREDGLRLELADDGPGIRQEIQHRLFEPYATTRKVGEGMGLGLAISRKILLDHGGDLELIRTSNSGTTFRLTFPAAPPAADETSREDP